MANNDIKPGMIVWLKTGGPAMTVRSENYNGDWLCSWFVGNVVTEHSFATEQLTIEDPNPPLMIV